MRCYHLQSAWFVYYQIVTKDKKYEFRTRLLRGRLDDLMSWSRIWLECLTYHAFDTVWPDSDSQTLWHAVLVSLVNQHRHIYTAEQHTDSLPPRWANLHPYHSTQYCLYHITPVYIYCVSNMVSVIWTKWECVGWTTLQLAIQGCQVCIFNGRSS